MAVEADNLFAFYIDPERGPAHLTFQAHNGLQVHSNISGLSQGPYQYLSQIRFAVLLMPQKSLIGISLDNKAFWGILPQGSIKDGGKVSPDRLIRLLLLN